MADSYLLKEDTFYLLLEDGSKIVLDEIPLSVGLKIIKSTSQVKSIIKSTSQVKSIIKSTSQVKAKIKNIINN